MTDRQTQNRFTWLLGAIVLLLATYPYYDAGTTGAFLGGLTSLLVLLAGVYAVRTHRGTLFVSSTLAILALLAGLRSLTAGVQGSAWTEAAFTLFYAFTTVAVFVEVVRQRRFTRDAIFGIVAVYMLIGLSFGSLYDLVETIHPGSYRVNVDMGGDGYLGFRHLLFYSFMTLTTIGYGDITPATMQAQSLSILQGVAGVLYVAVLIARIVNAYGDSRSDDERQPEAKPEPNEVRRPDAEGEAERSETA